jgi:uncharacterized protein
LRVFYLHGFASSARSSKAAFLAGRLAGRGLDLITPDFNEPDFTSLTVTRMVEQVQARLAGLPADEPVLMIGSSLGAFVTLFAAADPRVTGLVLLAPALEFSSDQLARIGDRTVEAWRRTGVTHVFHYGFGRVLPLGFGIYEDVAARPAPPAPVVPTVIVQGRQDAIVNPTAVERWAAAHADTTRLVLVDDDHQLGNSLDVIWAEVERLL